MMSFTREAIAMAEQFAKQCSEIQILHTMGAFDHSLVKSTHYTQIIKLYTGDSDKLTLLVEQELFEHFNKNNTLRPKLKNSYTPWRTGADADLVTIYIIGK